MLHDESPAQLSGDKASPASILRELLDCTELNMDDLEDHTRAVIQRARAVLEREQEQP
jgi:hypothetical protein